MKLFHPGKAIVSIALAAGAAALTLPAPAAAQTATGLDCKGCVGTKELGKEAVNGARIKPGTIQNKHLGKNIKAAGAAFEEGGSATDIGTDDTVISVVLKAPEDGYASVTVSGHSSFLNPNALTCSITTGVTVTASALTISGVVAGAHILPFTRQQMFAVTKGANTFNFVCTKFGGADQIDMDSLNMSALYVARNYTGN